MDLDDEELKATRIMNGANKSLGYVYKLEQRIKELEEVEQEHKKENGELRERTKELEEENEELKREKVDNSKIILLAQSGMLDYQKGYEDGKARRMSAVQNIVENQQYYILKKQFEKYEKYIDKLKEENTELKNLANNTQWISPCYVAQNYISKSKVKEKIEELKQEYKIALEENSIKAFILKCQIQILQELLEEQ